MIKYLNVTSVDFAAQIFAVRRAAAQILCGEHNLMILNARDGRLDVSPHVVHEAAVACVRRPQSASLGRSFSRARLGADFDSA